MNPLIVKGVVFGLLLACAALWDMKEREIPNLIPAMKNPLKYISI